MEPIPLEELKSEKYPRISAEDLIELGELAGSANSRSPTKKRQNSKPMILILDVRHHEEYPLQIDKYFRRIILKKEIFQCAIKIE